MITEVMTIHKALSTLKTLDNSIQSKINNACFVTSNKHSNEKIDGRQISEYENTMRSAYESINDLIKRRAAIRNALSVSNANTHVTIADVDYTVAEAIEMKKTGTQNIRMLVNTMLKQFANVRLKIETANGDQLQEKADAYISAAFGTNEKAKNEEITNAREYYIKQNTTDMIDPLNVKSELDKWNDWLDKFDSEVDAALSVSNAITTIEVNY